MHITCERSHGENECHEEKIWKRENSTCRRTWDGKIWVLKTNYQIDCALGAIFLQNDGCIPKAQEHAYI